jgi:penicillin-binding protein 1A
MKIAFMKKMPNRMTLIKSLITLAILTCIFFVIVGYRTYIIYQRDLPSFERLHNIEPSLKTKIYASDGTLLQEYFNENRVLTPYSKIPKHMIDMVMAVEDREFMNHWGVNLRRIISATMINVTSWRITQGASTVTQQLARMLFLNRKQTLERKIKEAMTAIKLERAYSKEEIIQMYLNEYYFGWGAYGIAAAARTYFNKSVENLAVEDCAFLVGLFKGPGRYSIHAFDDPESAIRTRNRSLLSYYDWGKITEAEYDSLIALPSSLNPPVEEPGRAPYFTEVIRKYLLDTYGEKALYSGGLVVSTTLDWDLQQVVEHEVKKKLDSMQASLERNYGPDNPTYTHLIPDTTGGGIDSIRIYEQIQGAAVSIDNATGNVLALIGGRSFEESKWNRAVQSTLTPGSAFKPFIYTAAIDNGYNPSDLFYDNSIKLKIPGAPDWRPHNYDFKFLGEMTLREALKKSRNLVAVKLTLKIGPEQAIFYAQKMGITTPMDPYPTLGMGATAVKPIELVSAYTVFPNGGIKIPYRFITKIVDRYGNILENNTAVPKDEVLSAQTAYIMVNMMQSVMEPGGTGQAIRWLGFARPIGGKTGTSDNWCDNWFIGYTPQITTGLWIGFDSKISLGEGQDGARNALPVWTAIMQAAHKSLPVLDFEIPDGIIFVNICLESGKLATDRCNKVRSEIFREENIPTEFCPVHPSAGSYNPNTQKKSYDDLPEDSTDFYHF